MNSANEATVSVTDTNEAKEEGVYGTDQTRLVNYSFGNVQTQDLTITGNVVQNNILTASPSDGSILNIPKVCTYLIIQNTTPYTQLTFKMPLEPVLGQMLTIISQVAIGGVAFTNASFGNNAPTAATASRSLRFYFADKWYTL